MAGEDLNYLDWIRMQPCVVTRMDVEPNGDGYCKGRIVPHHKVGAGMGKRAHDHESMPLCSSHHRLRHDASGPFKHWTRDDFRRWEDHWCTEMRERFLREEQDGVILY